MMRALDVAALGNCAVMEQRMDPKRRHQMDDLRFDGRASGALLVTQRHEDEEE